MTDETVDTAVAPKVKRGYRTRRFDVINYFTNEVVAERVLLSEYCHENDYDRANLLKTLGSDLEKNSSRDNRHHHKYVYLKEVEPESRSEGP